MQGLLRSRNQLYEAPIHIYSMPGKHYSQRINGLRHHSRCVDEKSDSDSDSHDMGISDFDFDLCTVFTFILGLVRALCPLTSPDVAGPYPFLAPQRVPTFPSPGAISPSY